MVGPSYDPFGIEYMNEPNVQPPEFRQIAKSEQEDLRWENLSWWERIRNYNRPSLLDTREKLTLVITCAGCEFRTRKEFAMFRKSSSGRLAFAGDEYSKEEELILRKCFYRLDNHLSAPFSSTSSANYEVHNSKGEVVQSVSHAMGTFILDHILVFEPKRVKAALLRQFAVYEAECLNGFKAKLDELQCWYQ